MNKNIKENVRGTSIVYKTCMDVVVRKMDKMKRSETTKRKMKLVRKISKLTIWITTCLPRKNQTFGYSLPCC